MRQELTKREYNALWSDVHGAADDMGLGHAGLRDKLGVNSMLDTTQGQLMTAFKELTGTDWNPDASPALATSLKKAGGK
jgi:hypothetical protein